MKEGGKGWWGGGGVGGGGRGWGGLGGREAKARGEGGCWGRTRGGGWRGIRGRDTNWGRSKRGLRRTGKEPGRDGRRWKRGGEQERVEKTRCHGRRSRECWPASGRKCCNAIRLASMNVSLNSAGTPFAALVSWRWHEKKA